MIQSRVDDVQQSEKVRIFHHEQHQKHLKRSAILKLETEQGLIEGHKDCSAYLEAQVAELLLNPAVLNFEDQGILLEEVEQVFTEADNTMMNKLPTKNEIKEVLFNSNLRAAPGTDGITSLLYHDHWDILGDSLHEVTTEIMKGNSPTLSQRTSLMVFGCKPKKMNSLLPSDKRRISLMNADYKNCNWFGSIKIPENTEPHTLPSPTQCG